MKIQKIRYALKKVMLRFFPGKTYTAAICGHPTKICGEIKTLDSSTIMEMPKNKDGVPDFCLECIGKMTIRCPWCKEEISIGDPITLYSTGNKDFKVPEESVVFKEDPLTLVGCLRFDCADTGCDRAGFWYPDTEDYVEGKPKGKVFRIPSPIEMMMAHAAQSDGKNPAVFVSDLTDPNNPGTVVEID